MVEHIPIKPGEFLATARLTWPDHDTIPPSVLYPGLSGPDAIYDLKILFSFLTGRMVYSNEDLDWDPRRSYGDPVISGRLLVEFANEAWERLQEISNQKLSGALSCLVHAPLSPDLVGWSVYAFAALETIVDSWASVNGRKSFQDKALINSARETIVSALLEKSVTPDVVDDIVSRFNQIKSPSPLTKLTWFLQAQDVFPSTPTQDESSRLRRLNGVRNAIVHNGTVRQDGNLNLDKSVDAAASAVLIAIEIGKLYIAGSVLGINTTDIDESRQTIRDYFKNGTFRGQHISDESYEEYLARRKKKWVELGVLTPDQLDGDD